MAGRSPVEDSSPDKLRRRNLTLSDRDVERLDAMVKRWEATGRSAAVRRLIQEEAHRANAAAAKRFHAERAE